jgi:hypothetical protein
VTRDGQPLGPSRSTGLDPAEVTSVNLPSASLACVACASCWLVWYVHASCRSSLSQKVLNGRGCANTYSHVQRIPHVVHHQRRDHHLSMPISKPSLVPMTMSKGAPTLGAGWICCRPHCLQRPPPLLVPINTAAGQKWVPRLGTLLILGAPLGIGSRF